MVAKQINVIGIVISVESAFVKPKIANATVNAEKNSFRFFIYHPPEHLFLYIKYEYTVGIITIAKITTINKILSDSTYKENAKKIAESFKNSSGAKGAADKIIQVCNDIKL